MDLKDLLLERLNSVAELALKPGAEDDFASGYLELLTSLRETMNLMKELALHQGRWLQSQAREAARDN